MLKYATVSQMKLSPKQLSSCRFPIEMINAVLNEETGEIMEYRHIMINPKHCQLYATYYSKELGRLVQGMPGKAVGTNNIYFICKADITAERWKDVTYGSVVLAYRQEKPDPYQTRLTVGGNLIAYPGDCGTPTVDLITVRLLLRSIVSTPGAKFMTVHIKDFYLNSPMAGYKYTHLKLCDVSEDLARHYNLVTKVKSDGYVCIEIRR